MGELSEVLAAAERVQKQLDLMAGILAELVDLLQVWDKRQPFTVTVTQKEAFLVTLEQLRFALDQIQSGFGNVAKEPPPAPPVRPLRRRFAVG